MSKLLLKILFTILSAFTLLVHVFWLFGGNPNPVYGISFFVGLVIFGVIFVRVKNITLITSRVFKYLAISWACIPVTLGIGLFYSAIHSSLRFPDILWLLLIVVGVPFSLITLAVSGVWYLLYKKFKKK